MISVVICTYNRQDMLRDTIESFLKIRTTTIDHELLVVDNRSTDGTRTVVDSFSKDYPFIRYAFESEQGLSAARNTGLRCANGEFVIFVDDDVFFQPQWLSATYDALTAHPDAECIGGRVLPAFESPPPAWLSAELLWIYGVTAYGDEPRELTPPELPIGCNMGFRRSLFDRIGKFSTGLGRKGKSLLSNEDNELLIRAHQQGALIRYVPDMALRHRVTPDRLERRWVSRRYYWQGQSDVALRHLDNPDLGRSGVLRLGLRNFMSSLRFVFLGSNGLKGAYRRLSSSGARLKLRYGLGSLVCAVKIFTKGTA